jgi:hypothetical protein
VRAEGPAAGGYAQPAGLTAAAPETSPDRVPPAAPPTGPALGRAEAPVVEAVRCYQSQAPAQAAQALQGCDRTSRDLLTCLLPLAVRLGEGDLPRADPQDVAALVEQLEGLLGPLRERAALQIPKLFFCRPVAAPAKFGKYEVLDENHLFHPADKVALYMELRNFACEPHAGDYRTHIATAVEVRDEQGRVVLRFSDERADPSLSPRQDFCQVGQFTLPRELPAGAYTLWLKVTDVPTGRAAKRSLDFRVTTVPARGT